MRRLFLIAPVTFCLTSVASGAPVLRNPSFDTPNLGGCPNFRYRPTDAGWTFTSQYAGITALGCAMHFVSPRAPEGGGGQAGFIQSLGAPAVLSQTVDGLVAGHSYAVSFFAAGRLNNPSDCGNRCGGLNFSVFVGASKLLDVQPSTTQFQHYTTKPFTAEATSASIAFSGSAEPGYDRTSFIDLVSIVDLGTVSVSSATTPNGGPAESGRNATLAGAISIPPIIYQCEGNKCDGLWTFNGAEGKAQWQMGARANLKVERFDAGGVIVRRTDVTGSSPGLTAVYTGKLQGNRIDGDVTWMWPGHWAVPGTGKWSATFPATVTSSLSTPGSVVPELIPASILECDGDSCGGAWFFNGQTQGSARWVYGAEAKMSIERFDSSGVVIQRFDQAGTSAGLTATYTGKVQGNRIDGTVTATWPGHFNDKTSSWTALVDRPAQSSSKQSSSTRFDLTGDWEVLAKNGLPMQRIRIDQNNNVVMATKSSRLFGNSAQVAFEGVYSSGAVAALVPATQPGGSSHLPWDVTTVTIEDPDTLHIGTGPAFQRVSDPPANDVACDDNNPFHVKAPGAWTRGMATYKAGEKEAALCWFQISSLTNPRAAAFSGLLFLEGVGGAVNYDEAFRYFLASATDGDYLGQAGLADMYEKGLGVPKNPEAAQRWRATSQAQKQQEELRARQQQASIDLFGALGQSFVQFFFSDDPQARENALQRERERNQNQTMRRNGITPP